MNPNYKTQKTAKKIPALRIIPLGGTGEVTKNMYVYEYGEHQLIVDCGIGFPKESAPGVDFLIPDITYLEKSHKKIHGMVITHGHMDHFGGLPYILPRLPNIPVYGSTLSMALAEGRSREFGIKNKFNSVEDHLDLGPFSIDFIHMTHSVPNCKHLLIKTPSATVYHGSDFKIDLNPLDNKPPDLNSIAQAGKDGIDLFLTDCLGVEKRGFTPSERIVMETLEKEMKSSSGRFILTTMSSSISRIDMVIKTAAKYNRKVALMGRSIEQNIKIAVKHGFIKIPANTLIKPQQVKHLPPRQVAVIIAGSQAQEGSSLYRVAAGEHRHLQLRSDDKVVLSSSFIPGNETNIYGLIDSLFEQGVDVVYPDITDKPLHVTGHGHRGDLTLLLRLLQPKNIIPIGGEIRHARLYQRMATKLGYQTKQTHILDTGQSVVVSHNSFRLDKKIASKNVYVDGLGIGDVGSTVLRDRQTMSNDGILLAIVPIDSKSSQLVGKAEIITRGFVYVKESQNLINKTEKQAIQILKGNKKIPLNNPTFIKEKIENGLEQFLFKQTGRRPLVIAILLEV